MSRKELAEIQEQIDYGRQVEERLKEELKELNGNINLLEHDLVMITHMSIRLLFSLYSD